jgi:hypothetical protein
MLIDRSHEKWLLFTVITTLLLSTSYLIYTALQPRPATGGTVPGLIYGSLALGVMIFASLLGARKKVPAWRIGRATAWMKGHIWLSILLVPLVLFHSGFRIGGTLTAVIWVLFGIVTLSGLVGLLFQQFLPRLMTEQVAMETVYDQIDHVIAQLRYEADLKMVALVGPLGFELQPPEGVTPVKVKEGAPQEGSDRMKAFYLGEVRPSLDPGGQWRKIAFDSLKLTVPSAFYEAIDSLTGLVEERRQLERQKILHHWMHGWLFVHMPLSLALLLLVIVHSITALWY